MKSLDTYAPVLRSPRFWALVFIGLAEFARTMGWFPNEGLSALVAAAELVVGGSAVVRTVDRHGEKK